MNNQKLASFVIDGVGGSENIVSVTHCMTRLRFVLHDYSLVDKEVLESNSAIMTAQAAPGQYQVVIGTGVASVYDKVISLLGLNADGSDDDTPKGFVNKLIAVITKSITPVLGILTASGLLQGILALLVASKLVNTSDGAYIVLHAMGQAVFFFFPVILGYTSAKAFKLNPFVGLILGAILVLPEFTTGLVTKNALYTLFSNTIFETPVYKTFFGIPIFFPQNGYSATVIPILFITFFGSRVQKFLNKIIPEILSHNLTDFLTILITAPISILLIGPISSVLGTLITNGIESMYSFAPIFAAIIVALLYQPLVILGLHWSLTAVALANMATMGYDSAIFPMTFTANFAQTAVVLAVFLRTRNKEQKTLAVPAMVSGLFCIIEPAIYGFSLPVKKRFAFSMLGGAAGALIMALTSTKQFAFSFGILGFAGYINPNNGSLTGVWIAILATVVTSLVAFIPTYFSFEESSIEETDVDDTLTNELVVNAPVAGVVHPLVDASDPVFASGSMGKGVFIEPSGGPVLAPISGTITAIPDDGHAVGITSENGAEILIHIGIDTAELRGQGFVLKIKQGEQVMPGQELVQVDWALLQKTGYNTETFIVVTNAQEFQDVSQMESTEIQSGNSLLKILPHRHKTEGLVTE